MKFDINSPFGMYIMEQDQRQNRIDEIVCQLPRVGMNLRIACERAGVDQKSLTDEEIAYIKKEISK
jgi:hypothetical protein